MLFSCFSHVTRPHRVSPINPLQRGRVVRAPDFKFGFRGLDLSPGRPKLNSSVMFVTRSSVLSSRSLSFEHNFLSFEHNQDIQSNAKGIGQAKRQSNSFTLSPHMSKNSFSLCFKQSNFIQFLLERTSVKQIFSCTAFISYRSFPEISDLFWN